MGGNWMPFFQTLCHLNGAFTPFGNQCVDWLGTLSLLSAKIGLQMQIRSPFRPCFRVRNCLNTCGLQNSCDRLAFLPRKVINRFKIEGKCSCRTLMIGNCVHVLFTLPTIQLSNTFLLFTSPTATTGKKGTAEGLISEFLGNYSIFLYFRPYSLK